MPPQYTRADALREYLTGAASDGGAQADAALSLGNYRSSTPARTYGIYLANAITNVTVGFASGGNPPGVGELQAPNNFSLRWKRPGSGTFGPAASFTGPGEVGIVESYENPGSYLRVIGSPPFSVGTCLVSLAYLVSELYGFPEVSEAQAAAGVIQYRAGIVRNESAGPVTLFKRWVATLGSMARSNSGQLPAAGAGTAVSSDSFAGWPDSGYVRVETNAGVLREIAYYGSRTAASLNVIARGLLGSTAAAGVATDLLWPVPGVAIALDPDGVEAFGSNIQTIANATTAPTGVTWKTGILPADGIAVATLLPNQQVGVWYKRQVPPGAKASGARVVKFNESFSAY